MMVKLCEKFKVFFAMRMYRIEISGASKRLSFNIIDIVAIILGIGNLQRIFVSDYVKLTNNFENQWTKDDNERMERLAPVLIWHISFMRRSSKCYPEIHELIRFLHNDIKVGRELDINQWDTVLTIRRR